MGKARSADASDFWVRYSQLTDKDLPVILKTGIKPSTLSSYKSQARFPRANEAVDIALALGVTTEYLVTGREQSKIPRRFLSLAEDISSLNEDDIAVIESLVSIKTEARRSAQANSSS